MPNHVEAFDQNGKSLGVIFETATPFDTPMRMEVLVAWTNRGFEQKDLHPLLIIAIFTVHFLAITQANRNTIKVRLRELVDDGYLIKQGKGKGTLYLPGKIAP